MQENTKSETPEDFSENEEPLSNEEETSPQEIQVFVISIFYISQTPSQSKNQLSPRN